MNISQKYWVTLPTDVREKIRQDFAILKSEGVEVVDNTIVSDGSTEEDLMAITKEALQGYLNTTEQDFDELWNATLIKVNVLLGHITAEEAQNAPVEVELEGTATIIVEDIPQDVKEPAKKEKKSKK
jgi:hypothetical protein